MESLFRVYYLFSDLQHNQMRLCNISERNNIGALSTSNVLMGLLEERGR
jgi:hypothetical protein